MAFVSVLLFLGSVAGVGMLAWLTLDEWVGNVRPLRSAYRTESESCWRCRKKLEGAAEHCSRCHATATRVEIVVDSEQRQFAVARNVVYGYYLRQSLTDGAGRSVVFLTPSALPARRGDVMRFVLDGKRTLRAVENVTLGSGWRMPTRALGQRSPLALAGLVFLVPAGLGLLLTAPLLYLLASFSRAAHMIQALGGKSPQLQHSVASAQTQTFTGIAYLLAALVVGGLLLQLRSRPSLGNTVEL